MSVARMYSLLTPSPPDLMLRPYDSVGFTESLSERPSANSTMSPLLLIARPWASMYSDIPSLDAEKSRIGNPWNARF